MMQVLLFINGFYFILLQSLLYLTFNIELIYVHILFPQFR